MRLRGSRIVYAVGAVAAILLGLSTVNYMSGGPGLVGIIQSVFFPQANPYALSTPRVAPDPVDPAMVAPPQTPQYPASTLLTFRQLLRERKFDELNDRWQRLRDNPDRDPVIRDQLASADVAFNYPDPSFASLLDEWVDATPGRYQPYLARANYWHSKAWGHKWASETDESKLAKMKDYLARALADAARAKEIDREPMRIYQQVIYIAVMIGDQRSARHAIEQAIAIDPADYYVRSAYLHSLQPRWGGSFEQMKAFVQESLQYADQNPKLQELIGAVYREAGETNVDIRKYSLAEELFTTALEYGDNAASYFMRGRNRYRMERFEEAIADLDKAIELETETASYYNWRALARAKTGDLKAAALDMHRAVQLNPFADDIEHNRSWLAGTLVNEGYRHRDAQRPREALDSFRYALLLDDSDPKFYYQRAVALIELNQGELAKTDLLKAIELKPDYFSAYKWLDYVLARQGEFDEIVGHWDVYLALVPGDSRAYVERGGAYFHKGDMQNAVANAKVAADMGNSNGKAIYERFRHLVN